jgi:mono/diheme cytochrome c family protein
VKLGVWHERVLALGCLSVAMQLFESRTSQAQPFVPTAPAQANYMLNCMGCHIADGSGAAGKVPSLRDSLVPLAMSTAGRRYLVQVPGVARSSLTDRELAQLLGWMVRNLSAEAVPAAFADFTAAEVAAYRKSPLSSVRERRARLLAQGVLRMRRSLQQRPAQGHALHPSGA